MEQVSWEAAEQALGRSVLVDLQRRGLLAAVAVPSGSVRAEWAEGAVVGFVLGDAVASWARHAPGRTRRTERAVRAHLAGRATRFDTVTALTQTMVLSIEAQRAAGWTAPAVLSDRLVDRFDGLRSPGVAIPRAVVRRREGAAWFEAASASFGDMALGRAVGVGIARVGEAAGIGLAASLDTVVTHAHPRAAASAAALAGIIAALVARPEGADPRAVIDAVIRSVDHGAVQAMLVGALQATGRWDDTLPPHAADVLAAALWFAMSSGDPVDALAMAVEHGGGERAVIAVTGALAGAIHGVEALPARRDDVEGAAAIRTLAACHPATVPPVATGPESNGADIWFLLDRSGSMDSIADDVVGGFDRFFAAQRAVSGEATVTVVQFDSEAPHDVIVDARPVGAVPSIRDRFQPRGSTPLYDAVGLLLDRAERHAGDDADQLVVILTDGAENASRHWDRAALFGRISVLQQRGWTFVFLGANQDSYAAGAGLSVHGGNVSNFAPTPDGVQATYDGLARTVTAWRGKGRSERRRDRDDFWGGVKEAEDADR